MLNVIYTLLASDADGLVDRGKVREELDRALRQVPEMITGPDRDTWGTSEDAIAGLAAAEAVFGPASR